MAARNLPCGGGAWMMCEVVVLGGGFAGLAAVGKLARRMHTRGDLRVRLVDRSTHSTFAPLLPDLLSGRLRPQHLLYDLRRHCRRLGVSFHHAQVTGASLSPLRVMTSGGPLSADFVVVCLGCESNYFGDAAMARLAPGLKSVKEGLTIRGRAEALAKALRHDARRSVGHLVIVGGGYTGFEVASHRREVDR